MSADSDRGETVKRRVVIAEDEAIIRLDLRETLESLGYEVVGDTGRADEAADLIRSCQPDLAILDIKMPGGSGLDVAREITSEGLCAVLVLTAFSQSDLILEATEAGVLAYLVKPFHKNELYASIEVAVARHEQMKMLADEARGFEEQLETRKLVDRAKGKLMDDRQMSESDAFAFVQKSAMRTRRSMKDVAAAILAGEFEQPD